jgi:hypothetical protein
VEVVNMGTVRIIKHVKVPGCGSFEVRSSQFIYWDDLPSRRLDPATLDRETAMEQAKAAARAARKRQTVWIYINTAKQVGAVEHLKVFANQEAAQAWFEENDPEGVAFEYEILK